MRRDADLIAFIDDDDLTEPDWLSRLIEKKQQTLTDIVFGIERKIIHTDWPAWLKEFSLFQKAKKEGFTEYGYASVYPHIMC